MHNLTVLVLNRHLATAAKRKVMFSGLNKLELGTGWVRTGKKPVAIG